MERGFGGRWASIFDTKSMFCPFISTKIIILTQFVALQLPGQQLAERPGPSVELRFQQADSDLDYSHVLPPSQVAGAAASLSAAGRPRSGWRLREGPGPGSGSSRNNLNLPALRGASRPAWQSPRVWT
jgi:hypothetical protein